MDMMKQTILFTLSPSFYSQNIGNGDTSFHYDAWIPIPLTHDLIWTINYLAIFGISYPKINNWIITQKIEMIIWFDSCKHMPSLLTIPQVSFLSSPALTLFDLLIIAISKDEGHYVLKTSLVLTPHAYTP